MPEAAPYGNAGCVVHRACVNRRPHSVTSGRAGAAGHMPAPRSHGTARSTPKNSVREHCGGAMPEATPRRCSAVHRRRSPAWCSAHPPPVHRYTHRPDTAIRPGPAVPLRPAGSSPRPPARTGAVTPPGLRAGQTTDSDCATIYFQPTSHPCRFLGELADQPPCHQARRDQAVRFHPTGTGHEYEAHFPARLLGETLRDRMLPAKLPCRHSAGWSTCHAGTAGRSRFDLGCRRLGTRARPRGNVQERQARKDQGDANTEGA